MKKQLSILLMALLVSLSMARDTFTGFFSPPPDDVLPPPPPG